MTNEKINATVEEIMEFETQRIEEAIEGHAQLL